MLFLNFFFNFIFLNSGSIPFCCQHILYILCQTCTQTNISINSSHEHGTHANLAPILAHMTSCFTLYFFSIYFCSFCIFSIPPLPLFCCWIFRCVLLLLLFFFSFSFLLHVILPLATQYSCAMFVHTFEMLQLYVLLYRKSPNQLT